MLTNECLVTLEYLSSKVDLIKGYEDLNFGLNDYVEGYAYFEPTLRFRDYNDIYLNS